MRKVALTAALVCCVACSGDHGEAGLRKALKQASGVVELPPGRIDISSELTISSGAHNLEIRGSPSGTVIQAAGNFRGRAVFHLKSGSNIRFANFTVDGNRAGLETPLGLPPADAPFSQFYANNGLLAEGVEQLTISGVRFRNITSFPILVSHSTGVIIERVHIENSGSKNEKGRNNTTGGILMEEGTSRFRVQACTLSNVRGNGVWTHSLYTSLRNQDGLIANNCFDTIGRDAIQIGHATNVRVENNTGSRIGYPVNEVDVEGGGTPVAIDTAGNVDQSVYAHNRFEEINGKCIDLDGFHHGEVRANTCVNRGAAEDYPHGHYAIVFNNTNPDMESENISVSENEIDGTKFGGIFIIGSHHRVLRNQLRNLNKAHCNENAAKFGCSHFPGEPDLLQTGIYLGRRAERPAIARDNVVADNVISGYKMSTRCIAVAPGVSLAANTVQRNHCSDAEE